MGDIFSLSAGDLLLRFRVGYHESSRGVAVRRRPQVADRWDAQVVQGHDGTVVVDIEL